MSTFQSLSDEEFESQMRALEEQQRAGKEAHEKKVADIKAEYNIKGQEANQRIADLMLKMEQDEVAIRGTFSDSKALLVNPQADNTSSAFKNATTEEKIENKVSPTRKETMAGINEWLAKKTEGKEEPKKTDWSALDRYFNNKNEPNEP